MNTVQTIQNTISTSTHITKTSTQLSKHPAFHLGKKIWWHKKGKVIFSVCLIKHCAVKTYGEVIYGSTCS